MVQQRRKKTLYKRKCKQKRVNIYVYAARLKAKMTPAEVRLWSVLQVTMTQWNVKFECQGVIASRFIADFVCRERMLIVELDGSVHQLTRVKARDKYRTKVLIGLGYTVVRFSNIEVHKQLTKVLNTILLKLKN